MSYGRKFFSGNSLEQALLLAARYFNLQPEELAYRQVERRHGFLRVRRRVVIEVDVANPRRDPSTPPPTSTPPPEAVAAGPEFQAEATAPDEETVVEGPGDRDLTPLPERPDAVARRFPRAGSEVTVAVKEAIDRLLALGKLSVEAEVFESDDGLQIEIRGADEDIFLEDRGRLLLSLQHLLPRLLRGLTGEATPCRVDCDNFQEIRAEQLRVLAQRVATEVRERGRPRTLEPMAPDERRIVHLTLADDPAVETQSQGGGLFKRVTVRPKRRRPQGFDPYSR